MILGIVNTKGGVGKTTTALYLAEAMRRTGRSVSVWDADPQGSASDWDMNARTNGTSLDFPVESVNLATLKRRGEHENVTIIDSPPGDPQVITAITERADYVIVPVDASLMDLKRAKATLNSLTAPAALLFCKTNERTQLYKEARAWTVDADISAFDTVIPQREDIKKQVDSGLRDADLHTFPDLAQEVIAVTADEE